MILVVGDINVDFLIKVPRFPEYDDDVSVKYLKIEGGGFAANFAYALRKLGTDTMLSGCVGNDLNGEFALKQLKEIGVDISNVSVKNAKTGLCISVIDETGVRRLMTYRGANLSFEFSDLAQETLKNSKWIHVSGLRPDVAFKIIKNSMNVSWDPGKIFLESNAKIQAEVIRKIDYLILNIKEWEALNKRYSGIIPKFKSIIIKKGKSGAEYYEFGRRLFGIPAFKVESVDSTGAGDVFNAAFVHSISTMKKSLKESLVFASAAGAFSVRKLGARSGAPSIEDVLKILSR